MKVVDAQSGRYFGLTSRDACLRPDVVSLVDHDSGRPDGIPFNHVEDRAMS